MKKILLILFTAVLVITVAACSAGTETESTGTESTGNENTVNESTDNNSEGTGTGKEDANDNSALPEDKDNISDEADKNGNGSSSESTDDKTGIESKDDKTEDESKDNEAGIDFNAYPADINEWTIDDIMDYFTKAGVFENDKWKYIKDEAECNAEVYGFNREGSYMSDDQNGSATVFIYYFAPDASSDKVKKQFEYIKANKTFDEAFDMQPVDHVFGNFAISYSLSLDSGFYEKVDKAYNVLVDSLGINADF